MTYADPERYANSVDSDDHVTFADPVTYADLERYAHPVHTLIL